MTDQGPLAPDRADPVPSVPRTPGRERPGWEIIAVLGVSLGMSAVYAILSILRTEITVPQGIGSTSVTVISGSHTTYPLLDLADDLANILNGLAPPVLALVLLARNPGGPGFGVGFDLRRRWYDLRYGIGFLALIGLPGLALVYFAHRLGLNASLQVVSFPDVWYRVPYLLLSAFQNGLSEEIVMIAFLLTRLRQLGWTGQRAIAPEALIRASYHLYQGFGGFAGNFVMGIIFGWWFQRTRRVAPLVLTHFLLDAISFIGYVYLHDRISWI